MDAATTAASPDLDPALLFVLTTVLYPSPTPLPDLPTPNHPTPSSTPLLLALLAALSSIPTSPSPPFTSHPSIAALLSLPPALRSARCRRLLGLPFPSFSSLLSLLLPFSASLPLPLPLSLPLALARLSRSPHLTPPPLPLPLLSCSFHAITRLLATSLYSRFVTNSDTYSSHLPGLLGAIACSPIRLTDEKLDGEFYSPARPFPSVLLQVVVDGRRVFTDACVLAPGGADAASHFRASRLGRQLLEAEEGGHEEGEAAAAVRGLTVRPYLAGNESFPLLPRLLTPFGGTAVGNPAYEAFDTVLAQAHRESVQRALSLLKGRWRILQGLDVGPEHAAQTVIACVVLHNMCQLAGEPEDEEQFYWHDPPEAPLQPASPLESELALYCAGESVRRVLADDLYERQQQHLVICN